MYKAVKYKYNNKVFDLFELNKWYYNNNIFTTVIIEEIKWCAFYLSLAVN